MTQLLRGERGSLPMALLAVLVVGSLVTVVTGTVVVGQQQTRFDQNFEQSLQIADAGIDQMVNLIESGERTDDFTVPTDVPAATLDGGTYTGTADHLGRGYWTVTSTGVADDGTLRSIRVDVEPESLFSLAAFGRVFVDLNGNNGADSYRSGTLAEDGSWTANPLGLMSEGGAGGFGYPLNPTGRGVVATNGNLRMRNNAWDATNFAEIHNCCISAAEMEAHDIPGSLYDASRTGYCEGLVTRDRCIDAYNQLLTNPDDPTGPLIRRLRYYYPPIELPAVVPPTTPTASFPVAPASNTLGCGVYAFTSAVFNSSTTFTGTPDCPTVLYLTGTLTLADQNTDYNFSALQPRPSPGLIIFSSSGGTALDFSRPGVRISAALYAPNGAFSGGSNSHIYGAVIAGSINSLGDWAFHYDEGLQGVIDGARPVAVAWTEI